MKKYLIPAAIIMLAAVALFAWNHKAVSPTAQGDAGRTQVGAATYACDGEKAISAIYYEDPSAAPMEPTDRPVPTGSVELSLNGAASTTFAQTISGSGVRYANEDESFVFWNKGNEAIIMRDNSMDLEYRNCLSS